MNMGFPCPCLPRMATALERIAGYFGMDPTFATYAEIETYIRTISAPFGNLTDEQWADIARRIVAATGIDPRDGAGCR